MDRLPYRQKFLNDRNSKICYHSLKDHPKVSKIAVSLRNVVKCERYRPAKFTNFVYFCITKRKIDTTFSKVVSIFRA